MGGLRARKNQLIIAVKALLLVRKVTIAEAAGFEAMYRRCRTLEEQAEVTKALHFVVNGWEDPGRGAAGGTYAHLRRLRAGIDPFRRAAGIAA